MIRQLWVVEEMWNKNIGWTPLMGGIFRTRSAAREKLSNEKWWAVDLNTKSKFRVRKYIPLLKGYDKP